MPLKMVWDRKLVDPLWACSQYLGLDGMTSIQMVD